jgi:hypothetical protein
MARLHRGRRELFHPGEAASLRRRPHGRSRRQLRADRRSGVRRQRIALLHGIDRRRSDPRDARHVEPGAPAAQGDLRRGARRGRSIAACPEDRGRGAQGRKDGGQGEIGGERPPPDKGSADEARSAMPTTRPAKDKPVKPTRVDFAGLAERFVPIPVAERNYEDLIVASDGSLFYLSRRQPGSITEPPGPGGRRGRRAVSLQLRGSRGKAAQVESGRGVRERRPQETAAESRRGTLRGRRCEREARRQAGGPFGRADEREPARGVAADLRRNLAHGAAVFL